MNPSPLGAEDAAPAPLEIRVANLVKEGLTTKEIGRLLDCPGIRSRLTGSTYGKLNLLGKGANLRVFLGALR